MAIDWKTIISEFDGKPTLLQAVGKLRKAVEDETITIQQAQAEIAKLEAQQKADEALITTAQTTANNAQSAAQAADTKAQAADTKAQAADTKAQQALNLAKTNETDIATLDGQVTALQTEASIEITLEPSTVTSGTLTDEQYTALILNDNCYIKLNEVGYTLSKNSATGGLIYTSKYLSDTKTMRTITVTKSTKAWVMTEVSVGGEKFYIQKLAWKNIDHSTNLFITPFIKVLTKTSTPLSITTAEEFSDKLKNLPVVGLGGTYYDSQASKTYLPDYFTTETNNLFYLGGIGFSGGTKTLNASKLMDTTQYTLSITVEEF